MRMQPAQGDLSDILVSLERSLVMASLSCILRCRETRAAELMAGLRSTMAYFVYRSIA